MNGGDALGRVAEEFGRAMDAEFKAIAKDGARLPQRLEIARSRPDPEAEWDEGGEHEFAPSKLVTYPEMQAAIRTAGWHVDYLRRQLGRELARLAALHFFELRLEEQWKARPEATLGELLEKDGEAAR